MNVTLGELNFTCIFLDYSERKVTAILNSELADTLGNLLNRCTGLVINKNQVFPGCAKEDWEKFGSENAENLINSLKALPRK